MSKKPHWEQVYATKPATGVSWYSPHLDRSLQLIERAVSDRVARIIDVGGGASTLVDDLVERGHQAVTVLDLSEEALAVAKARLGARAAGVILPLLADGSRVVNMSSGLARYVFPGFPVYSAVKGSVEVLTRALAVELGPRRIAVNVVAPGGIVTDFGGGVMRDPGLQKTVAAETPLGRVGEPEDVAGMIAMLLAPETRWITGQRVEVTGGYRL
jgi:hypothetical protein